MTIRFKVYCLRKGWEQAEAFPDERETDAFDEAAVHILLSDRATGEAVGTARLIYADPALHDGNLPSLAWSPEFRDRARQLMPVQRTIELSRVAVTGGDAEPGERRPTAMRAAAPMLGLIKGMLQASAADDAEAVCLTTTLSMQRMLKSFGFRFHDVGVRIQHRGTRAPLYRDIAALLFELHGLRPDVWRYVTDDGDYWPLDQDALERERSGQAAAMLCEA